MQAFESDTVREMGSWRSRRLSSKMSTIIHPGSGTPRVGTRLYDWSSLRHHYDPATLRGDDRCALLVRLHMIPSIDRVESVPSVDDRPYGHILDTNIFTLPKSPDDPNYSLCRACLLVAIRQEIFISFVARTPPPRLAERCGITRTLEPASDFDWAWRIITFTEDVLIFAYGPDARSVGSWENLRAYLHQWMEKRPASFNPLWQAGSDREAFPEIIFANDFHSESQYISMLLWLA